MTSQKTTLIAAGMICVTIVVIFVAMPIIRATSAYNVAAETYQLEAMCDLSGEVANQWAALGPLGRADFWRAQQDEDCGRVRIRRAQQEIYRSF